MSRISSDGLLWLDVDNKKNDSDPEDNESVCIQKAIAETESRFWDIGAYHGMYALRLAKAGKSVVAFEPHPFTFPTLKQNIELNNLDIEAKMMAISSANGKMEFLDDGSSSRLGVSLGVKNRLTVECSTIDSLIYEKHLLAPDFIKIDAEGYEVEILKGAILFLMQARPKLLIECHDIQILPDVFLRFNQPLVETILSFMEYKWEEVYRKKLYAWPLDEPVRLYSPSLSLSK